MTFGLTFFGDILVAAGSYVAAIYTWPFIRGFFVSAQSEIATLEAKLGVLRKTVPPVPPPSVPPTTTGL